LASNKAHLPGSSLQHGVTAGMSDRHKHRDRGDRGRRAPEEDFEEGEVQPSHPADHKARDERGGGKHRAYGDRDGGRHRGR